MLQDLLAKIQLGSFGPLDVICNLLVALVMALFTSLVYRITHSGYSYSRSFNVTMIGVALVITMIMMVIGNYIALSLGLIGALSVIRFRTAVKDPKDLTYLFICIAIGLACSTGDYVITVIGTVFINLTLCTLHFLRFGCTLSSDYILSFNLNGGKSDAHEIAEKIRQKIQKVIFRSFSQINENKAEFVYSLKLGKISEEEIISFFKTECQDMKNIALIAPETNIEM